jgi:hypothetical protein
LFIGKRNPNVRLGVANLEKFTGTAKPEDYIRYFDLVDQMDIRFHTLQEDNGVVETEYYVCRADWWPDGTIMAQVNTIAHFI